METSLHIKGLTKAYQSGKPVLKGIDLNIQGNGMTAIIGPSGTGKSTLLRCLNRLVEPTQGSLLLSSSEGQIDLALVKGKQLRMARRQIGMVFQEYNLVERLTVMENLLTGRLGYIGSWRAWRRKFEPSDIAYAFELLAEVGLSDFANQRADALSGGQRQRVGIARALMQRPRLLLNIPVIVNIHDVDLAKRFADRIVGMTGGHVVYDNTPDALETPMLQKIYGGESWLH
jgi:phosphonate transport system ATP-binding protein